MAIIIFGCGAQAELANYYFNLSGQRVDFHMADADAITQTNFCKVPVLEAEERIIKKYKNTHKFFIAIGYSNLNSTRERIFERVKKLGCQLTSFVSDDAKIHNSSIGENCLILEQNNIQPFSKIGDNVVLWSGNHVGHHSVIEENVFVSSHVVIGGHCVVGRNTFLGVNATIGNQVRIGQSNLIGASALITGDTEDSSCYIEHQTQKSRIPSSRLRLR